MALPASLLAAGALWVELLSRNRLAQAWTLIGSGALRSNFTPTQYQQALTWLVERGLVVASFDDMQLSSRLRGSDVTEARVAIASAALAERAPHWLHASEIIEPDDPPADAVELQSVLSLRPNQLELAIAQAKQKVDARRREEIGAAGEAGLASWIEANGLPVSHVSLDDDTLGYDLVVQAGGTSWHVEVKSSTQPSFRGVYLSRHELEVSRLDPRWLLVLVALDGALKLQGVRTVTESDLAIVAPRDHHPSASWMSARFTIPGADLVPGLRLGDSTLTFT